MTEATDTFSELTRRGHQVFAAAAQAWEQAARSMTDAAGRPGSQLPDVGASVDAAFDFAAQMLADQRDFTRTLMSAGAQAIAAAAQRPVPAEPAATGDPVRAATKAPAAKATAAKKRTAAKKAPAPTTAASKTTAAASPTAPETTTAKKKTAKKKSAKKKTSTSSTPAKRARARDGGAS